MNKHGFSSKSILKSKVLSTPENADRPLTLAFLPISIVVSIFASWCVVALISLQTNAMSMLSKVCSFIMGFRGLMVFTVCDMQVRSCIFYFSFWCQLIFLHPELQVAAYDTVQKKMAFFDPSRAKDFLFISGTKVRNSILFPVLYLKLHIA